LKSRETTDAMAARVGQDFHEPRGEHEFRGRRAALI